MSVDSVVAAVSADPLTTARLFGAAVQRAEKTLKEPLRSLAVKALASLEGYKDYLEETNNRVAMFKTFATPTKPVSLLAHFVSTELEFGEKSTKIDQNELISKLMRPAKFVISGVAGYGKTMVMRYIAVSLYENPRGRIPLFIELRHLNRMKDPNILAYIHNEYKRFSEIKIESLKQGLEGGAFVILLDGFDELNHDIRDIVQAQILEISATYQNCSIVISGRPNDRFSSWRMFTVLKLCPMKKESVIELISKLEYDVGVKKRFIKEINNGLYERHVSFLSTPLLVILMLVTFELNATIPEKMHLFYAKAYETLFEQHDAMKEQYNRSRKSNLQIDEFAKVFSVFCLKSYVNEKLEFTTSEIMILMRDALKFENHECPPEQVVSDAEEAICLMMKEGSSYFFIHRSFQEYFTALFLSFQPDDVRDKFIASLGSRHWDNVLPMLFDMASDQLEPSWVKRYCDEYLARVSLNPGEGQISPTEARFGGLGFFEGNREGAAFHLAHISSGELSWFIVVMRRFYQEFERCPRLSFDYVESLRRDADPELEALISGTEQKSEGEGVTIVNVPCTKLPGRIIDRLNLRAFADFEYRKIVEIRGRITKEQEAKQQFLNDIFND